MKKITLMLTALVVVFMGTYAQNIDKEKVNTYLSHKRELIFSFQVQQHADVAEYAKELSILNYNSKNRTVTAWANASQFKKFEALDIPYQISESDNEVKASKIYTYRPCTTSEKNNNLQFPLSVYPTYEAYEQQMQNFETLYPNLVDKFSIGTTTEGDKELLFVKISDNIEVEEQEPKLLLTSSIHGDEIAGFPMMLTLIDYLLNAYTNEAHEDHLRIKYLVDHTEIWINPNANPDGTYHNSPDNTSIINARRGNANNVDLNRNYPDHIKGAHSDGERYQAETLAFMNVAEDNHFVLSANFHGGSELVNYPFDNVYTSEYEHPDGNWFEFVGAEYATKARAEAKNGLNVFPNYTNKPSYMMADEDSDIFPSLGVTHGAEWYRVFGGRQDYMNYYKQCKEITIELSEEKILPENRLVDYWYYNKESILNFLMQGTYGFQGTVKDAYTNQPIKANVTIMGHDDYGSHTFSDSDFGAFYRPIKAGTYDIIIEAKNYQPLVMINQSIADYQTKNLGDIVLIPEVESLSVSSEVAKKEPSSHITTISTSFIEEENTDSVLYKR